jgi:serine/threonine protein kinase
VSKEKNKEGAREGCAFLLNPQRNMEIKLETLDKMFAARPMLYSGLWYEARGPFSFKNDLAKWTMFRIEIPLDEQRKKVLAAKKPQYANQADLKSFERSIMRGLKQSQRISKALKADGIRNVLTFPKGKTCEDKKGTYIFLWTDKLVHPAVKELSDPSLTVGNAIRIIYDTMQILVEMSDAGYAHRNVNPASIYLAEDGTVYLGDFLFSAESTDRDFVLPVIDCDFLAPQVIAGGFGGIGADMFSAALILLALFTGQSLMEIPDKNKPFPSGVPQVIRDAISIGITGNPDKVEEFCTALLGIKGSCPRQWETPVIGILKEDEDESNLTKGRSETEQEYSIASIIQETQNPEYGLDLYVNKDFALQRYSNSNEIIQQMQAKQRLTNRLLCLFIGLFAAMFIFLVSFAFAVFKTNGISASFLSSFPFFSSSENQTNDGEGSVVSIIDTDITAGNNETNNSEGEESNVNLATPSGLSMTIDEDTIVVTWSEVENADGYTVYFADNEEFTDAVTLDTSVARIILNDNGYVDNYIKVRAYRTSSDSGNVSDWSDIGYLQIN